MSNFILQSTYFFNFFFAEFISGSHIHHPIVVYHIIASYGISTSCGSLDDAFLCAAAKKADVLVQCSSVGNYAHPELKFESLDYIDSLKDTCVVADVNYPSTPLLERAAARGLKTLSGESMMYYQQLAVIKLRFGIDLPLASMQNAREAVAIAVALRPYYNCDEIAQG
mgnify:CR=1 FL=1